MFSRLPAPLQVFVQAIVLWWDNWFLMILLTLIGVVSWLTIIFGPPVTFGIYKLVGELIDKDSYGLRGLFSSVKSFFLKSWGWALANLILAVVLFANQTYYGQIETTWATVIRLISISAYIFWLAVQFYALPYFIMQKNKSILLAWRNGMFTLLAYPLYSVVILALSMLIVGLSAGTVVPALLGVPMLAVVLGVVAIKERVENLDLPEA